MSVLIGVLVAVFLTGSLAAIAFVLLRLGEQAEISALEKAADGVLPKSFAYTVRKISSSVTIENTKGDATVIRHHEGIKPNDGFAVHKLKGQISGSGTVRNPPKLQEIDRSSEQYTFTTTTTKSDFGESAAYTIEFTPPLQPPDEVSVTVAMEFDALHLMTRAAVAAKFGKDEFPNEYHAFKTNIPTDQIELEVVFPSGFEATVGAVAFYGDTEVISKAETRKIRRLVKEQSDGSFHLRIEKPQFTLMYAIYWVPKR